MTSEILSESTHANFKDKLPFTRSYGSFAGSGKYVTTAFVQDYLSDGGPSLEKLRYAMMGIMNMNMFGIQMSGPLMSTLNHDTEEVIQNVTATYFQLSAYSPLAIYQDNYWYGLLGPKYENSLFGFSDKHKNMIRNGMRTRYKFIHMLYTCLFEAHDSGNTCYDPVFFHFPEDTFSYRADTRVSAIVADSILVSPD